MNGPNNPIGWCDYTWNPITGCLHDCWYCYAKKLFTRFGKSFEPTFYPERLDEPYKLKKPAKIFVCSVADLFADWTPKSWRDKVLEQLYNRNFNHLTFQLLTKNPENIPPMPPRSNIWIGATITRQIELDKMYMLVNKWQGNKFLSFEPLLEAIIPHRLDGYFSRIHWVIIGKLTGSKKVKLEKEWVLSLMRECSANRIPIFMKNNLKKAWKGKLRQEFPESGD